MKTIRTKDKKTIQFNALWDIRSRKRKRTCHRGGIKVSKSSMHKILDLSSIHAAYVKSEIQWWVFRCNLTQIPKSGRRDGSISQDLSGHRAWNPKYNSTQRDPASKQGGKRELTPKNCLPCVHCAASLHTQLKEEKT